MLQIPTESQVSMRLFLEAILFVAFSVSIYYLIFPSVSFRSKLMMYFAVLLLLTPIFDDRRIMVSTWPSVMLNPLILKPNG